MATASACGSADACATMKSLPPVSPTMRGYVAYCDMFAPIVFHILLNTPVLPVKCTPASSRCDSRTFDTSAASPGTKLITPGGRPAASRSFMRQYAESIALDAGFQITVLPMSAGAVGRLPPIDVKLNGVTA